MSGDMTSQGATVTDLATRRGGENVLSSITFVFGGVHYGTLNIATPYATGKPIALYVVPRRAGETGEFFSGPLDCLVTDDAALAADLETAR